MDVLKILLIVVAVIVVYILITYNQLVKKRLGVQQSKSGIDVYLKQRFDLIPNLVECVKAYSKHEQDTFVEISKLRTAYNEKKDLDTGAKLNAEINNLILYKESYPELKANEQFTLLEKNLSKMESQLQAARRLYNSEVTNLNVAIDSFPSNIIAGIFNFTKEPLFELENPEESKNVNIKLTDEKGEKI